MIQASEYVTRAEAIVTLYQICFSSIVKQAIFA